MANLNESLTTTTNTHVADHAALKVAYLSRGTGRTLPDFTQAAANDGSLKRYGQLHDDIHATLHAEHNALGAATTLPTTITGTGHTAHHIALHKAHNLRQVALPATGLRGWWKADAITSPPSDGGNMVSWTDSSGSSHPFTIVDGNPPVYRSSGSFLANSKPCVEFTASNSQDMGSNTPNNTATTKAFVFRLKTLPATGMIALYGSAGGLQVSVTSTGKVALMLSGQFGLITGGTATLAVDTWYVVTATSDGATSHITYVNGVQDATSSTSATFTAVSATLGSPGTGGDFLNGYIAEAIDYSRVLSSAEITQVNNYLTSKYFSSSSPSVPTNSSAPVAGWWSSDLTGVPVGSAGSGRDSGTATALELRKQWDYWDQTGASVINPTTDGLTNPPLGKNLIIKWQKPAGTTIGIADQVYQKMNRTFNAANWPNGSPAPVAVNQSPADPSGCYVTYRYIPSGDWVLNPAHGWFSLMSFKENYLDAQGNFHQDGTGWKVGGDNFSGSGGLRFRMTNKVSFLLSDYMDRWIKLEYRLYVGAKDTTGHGGRIELWIDNVLLDTGYEGDAVEGTPSPTGHIGSANYAPLAQTQGLIWVVGQYTSNQTTNGTPDYVNTHVTSYIGPTWVQPLPVAASAAGINLDYDFDNSEDQAVLSHPSSGFQINSAHQKAWLTTPTRLGTGHSERFEIHNSTGDIVNGQAYRSMMDVVDTNDGGDTGNGVTGYPDVYWCFSSYIPVGADANATVSTGFTQVALPEYTHLLELHERGWVNGSTSGVNNINEVSNLAIMIRNSQLQFRGRCGTWTWNGTGWDKPSWSTTTPGTTGSNDQIPIPIVKSGGTNATMPTNVWVDIIFHVSFSKTSTGLVEVWARQAGQAFTTSPNLTINGPTHKVLVGTSGTRTSADYEASSGTSGCYMHCGLYAGTTSWGDTTNSANVHIIDEVRRYGTLAAAKANWG
jgi:hypothetical protein